MDRPVTSRDRHPRSRRWLLAIAIAASYPAAVRAQTVSPPIAEYQERARSSFQLSNGSIFPLTVVLEAQGFDVTEAGDVTAAPLDTARIHLKLSATSFRMAPRSTYTVFYEATGDSLPAWFAINAAMSGARTDNGLNLRIILPHVVYLNQKQPLKREDVALRGFELDTVAKKVRILLENLSPRLGRVLDFSVTGTRGQSRAGGAFPLLPGHRRLATLDWGVDQPPARVSLRFAKFAIDTALTPTVASPPGETADGGPSRDAYRSGAPPSAGAHGR